MAANVFLAFQFSKVKKLFFAHIPFVVNCTFNAIRSRLDFSFH